MATFDNPFDGKTELATGCNCGRHASQSEPAVRTRGYSGSGLRERRRVGGDAHDVPAGCGTPHIFEVSWRSDRAQATRNHIIDFLVTRSKTFSDPARDPRKVPLVRPGINEPVIVSSSTGEAKRPATIQSNVK